jgi:hypothetical protein
LVPAKKKSEVWISFLFLVHGALDEDALDPDFFFR